MKGKDLVQWEIIKINFRRYSIYSMIYIGILISAYTNGIIASKGETISTGMLNMSNFQFHIGIYTFIIPIILATMFNYMYSSKKSVWTNSLPYTKVQVYISNVVAGIILLLIPYMVSGILFAGLSVINPEVVLITTSKVLGISFAFAFANIFVFTIASMVATLSGSTLVHVIFTYGLLVLPVGIVVLVSDMLEYVLNGFISGGFRYGDIGYLEKLSPTNILNIYNSNTLEVNWSYYVIYGLIIVIAILLGVYFVKRRREENVDEYVAFKWAERFLQFMGSFSMSVFLALILSNITRDYSPQGFFIRVLVIGFIVYAVMTAYFRKRINILKDMKMYGVFVVAILGIYLMGALDVTGYQSYIPQKDEVSNVEVYSFVQDNLYGYGLLELTSEEEIEWGINLHETMLENSSEWLRQGKYTYTNALTIRYETNDGDFITRDYELTEEGYENVAYIVEEVKPDYSEFDVNKMTNIYLGTNYSQEADDEKIRKVMEVYKEELAAMSVDELLSNNIAVGQIGFQDGFDYYYWSIGDEFTETLKVLNEEGYYPYDEIESEVYKAYAYGYVGNKHVSVTIGSDKIKEVYDASTWKYINDDYIYIGFEDKDGEAMGNAYIKASDLEDIGVEFD